METIKGTLIAMSPIHHGGDEKTGAESMLRRNKVVVNESIIEVPYISGNAIRGILRRYIMSDFLQKIEYEIKTMRLYHTLFTGGILETVDTKSSGTIDLELRKKVIKFLPPVRMLGMSYGNQIVEGKLHVGLMRPICAELKEYLPDNLNPHNNIYEFLDFTHQTRKDDIHADRKDNDQAVQMLINYEVFIPGTKFWHEIKIEDANKIDKGVVARMIELWKQKPYIGGKSSIGLGELKINYNPTWDPKPYLNFINTKKDEIKKVLEEIDR